MHVNKKCGSYEPHFVYVRLCTGLSAVGAELCVCIYLLAAELAECRILCQLNGLSSSRRLGNGLRSRVYNRLGNGLRSRVHNRLGHRLRSRSLLNRRLILRELLLGL